MTKIEEIKKKIESLRSRIFMINMSDHLSSDDYENIRKYKSELAELEEELSGLLTDDDLK